MDPDAVTEEEEERKPHSGAPVFQVVGTVCDTCAEDRPRVLEEYKVRT